MKPAKNYHEDLLESLKNSKEAVAYINAALEEKDMPEVFLLALRNVVEAHGISKIAKKSGLNRENLYRILSRKGNPELLTLHSLLKGLDLQLHVEFKKAS